MLFSTLLSISLSTVAPKDTVLLADSLTKDVIILAVSATDQTPVSQTNITKKQIENQHHGADLPYLLHSSPSMISQSDAGNGFGYSYFRLRGIDNTRINFNINGIPVNDPENHGIFTNNFADLASSASAIQIQRGVGTSSNGTAPIAGSINITTQDVQDPKFTKFTLGYGSYDSRRITVEHNTGINKESKFGIYARGSILSSNGFRNRSASDMKTFLLSGGYFGKRSTFKFNLFGGGTQNELSYYAVSKSALEADYRTNWNSPREKDKFQQFFYQLQYSFKINDRINLSAMGYYVSGNAPQFTYDAFNNFPDPLYYEYYNLPDPSGTAFTTSSNFLLNYRLEQANWGGMLIANYKAAKLNMTLGLHTYSFKANHFMEVWDADAFPNGYQKGHLAYFNTGMKKELSAFYKINYVLFNRLTLFGDIQLRNASFSYDYSRQPIFAEAGAEPMNWLFLNPKAGAKVAISSKFSAYSSFGFTMREPARLDMFEGNDFAPEPKNKNNIPKSESVANLEIGVNYKSEKMNIGLNAFAMEFRNEIAATGSLNNFGYYLRQNVGQSFRRGLELEASIKILKNLNFSNATSLSYNRIKDYNQSFLVKDEISQTKVFDANGNAENKVETFQNVNPVLTPSFTTYNSISYSPIDFINLEIIGRFVGKMYLDNTNNEQLTTPEYFVTDAKLEVKLDKITKVNSYLRLMVNNVFNTKFYTSGTPSHWYNRNSSGTDSRFTEPNYFVGALRNVMITAGVKF